jgi:hypothetical protein
LVNEQDATQRSAREASAREASAREASAALAFNLPRPARRRERRRVKWAATLVVLVLAVLGFASYEFAANAGHGRPAAALHPDAKAASAPVTAASVLPSPASESTAPASSPPATTAPPAPLPSRVLTVASVAAFGPQGTADGQHPQTAARALSGDAATPWLSDWYVSPDFFDLPYGTGLLLDMGRTVTVTSVRVSLNGHGANLQLRAGAKPAPAWLPVVASVSDAGGIVRLAPNAPVHVRYLLLWFTHLPPDADGTYQASVYQIAVKGRT